MTAQTLFRPEFLERTKRMSGLKTDAAFAGAIGVSESVLNKARRTNVCTPAMLVGLWRAFGFQPGEICYIADDGKEEKAVDTATAQTK